MRWMSDLQNQDTFLECFPLFLKCCDTSINCNPTSFRLIFSFLRREGCNKDRKSLLLTSLNLGWIFLTDLEPLEVNSA